MNIDWFTFAAQLVNFLVLVVLLRWLLYGPIVRAMNKREEKITGRMEEADQKQEEAEEKAQEYEEKSREIDQRREQILKEARHEAQEERQRRMKEAKRVIDRRREQWQDTLQREQEEFLSDLRRQAGKMGLHAARHTLDQLADTDLQSRMCDVFAERLEQLGGDQREKILHQLNNGQSQAVIRSAFEMPDDQQERFRDLIHKTLESDMDVAFQRSADLICGLELDVGGNSFGWNVSDLLRDVEMEFSQRLKHQP